MPAMNEAETIADYDLDYYRRIERYASIFGERNLIIKPYEQEQFLRGNLIYDFLAIFKVCGENLPQFKEKVNQSLTRSEFEIFRYLNKFNIPNFRALYSLIIEHGNPNHNVKTRAKYFMSPKERTDFYSSFVVNNSLIAKKYLEKEQLFQSQPSNAEDPNWNSSGAASIENITQVLIKLWSENKIK
jgi:hypothetical protein